MDSNSQGGRAYARNQRTLIVGAALVSILTGTARRSTRRPTMPAGRVCRVAEQNLGGASLSLRAE